MKLKLAFLLCLFSATCLYARDFVFLFSRADWDSISNANKTKVRDELKKCTPAPIPMKLNWLLREKGTTNEWSRTICSPDSNGNDAWVLNMKEKFTQTKLDKIKAWVNKHESYIGWTTNFPALLASKGLEYKPQDEIP